MKRRLRSHCTSGRLLCRRCSLTRPLLLVLFTVLTTLWCAAVASRAALTRFDAVSWSPTQIVASLTSSTPSETTREPLPVYGGVVNTSLQGIYCVDVENQVVYTGADVLHVFEIKSLSGSMVITESAGATVTESYDGGDTTTYTPAYYFEQVNEIYLTGWATACIFANRYELFISTTTVAPDETSRRGAAPPGSTTARKTSTMNHGHYYTVIHRYLRKALRTFASDAPPLEPASASTAKNLLSGASLVLRTGAVDGFSTRVVTPFWDGTICFEEVQTPFSAAQYWTLGPSSFPQSLVQPAEGQQSGNSTLYALAFTKPSLAASSSTSPWPAVYAWDIVGITLPEVHRDVADVPIAPASVSERFARCYASLIAAQCVDCLPVAFAASKRGIFLALTSRERNATYVTLLASGTDCTTEQQQQQQATTPTSAGESRGDNQQEVVLLQILTGVCNVAAMVVDDYALSHLYVAVECGQHRNSEKGQAQRYLVRVNMSTVDGDSSATTQVVPVQQPSPLPTTFTDDGTEEIMSLSLSNETRFLYLVVRRADATVRVYTYAAFGLSTLLPRAVDVAGGLSVRALGFGLTPGMQCVFNGSADAVIVANFSNSTALVCAAPSLSAALCTLHPVSLRLPYTQPWAVPSALPLHAVVSPAAAPLAYVATPVVEKAINEKTGRNSATANTNVAVIVTGHNFVNGSVYGLDSTCYFWSLINQGRPNITAPATYINATALRCEFHDMKMIGCRTFVSVSIDGTVVSPTSAAFSVQGVATQVRVQVGVQNNSGQTSDISHASAQEPATHTTICLQSSAQVALPDIEAVLADAVRNAVDLPDLLSPLYAVLSFNDTWLMNGGGVVPLNNTVKADSTAASVASVEGDIVQPFAADGRASFVGITLKCPPIGKFTYYVYVSNGTDKLLDYHRGSVRIEVREGAPYAPVFVGQPSTWYYPDASLLLQQPVVGVRDACGNVYSFLNDSVLVGSLTVQLYKEVVLQRSKGNAEVVRREPYGAAWEVSTPLNNLFYLSNISFPAIDFSTQFYLNVTCDLPQPTIRSPPIIVMPCEADRVSRIVTTAEFGSEGQLLLPLHSRIVCDACPAHGICDGTSNVRAKDGYWRHNASTTQFTSCRFAFGMAEACVNDGQCAAGYHGVLCGECDLGYHTLGRACRKCLPRGLQGFLVFLVVFGMVLIMTTFVVLMALVPPSTLSGLSIRSLLLAVQVTSLFILIAVPWPHQLETLFNGLYALAEVLETMVRCFTSPQSYFIFIACSPLVLVSLVMVLAGVCLRVMRLHRVDAYRLSAVVLTALLHRKQERFHQLRHTIAQEIAEQGRAAMRRRRSTMNNNAFAERAAATAGESYSATASATRPSLSTEWELLERNAAASISRRVTHAASTALMDSFTATVPTIALAATAPRVERCMES
ncbi:putative transmembrane protein, partial [Leptomonas pyrrhocoris]